MKGNAARARPSGVSSCREGDSAGYYLRQPGFLRGRRAAFPRRRCTWPPARRVSDPHICNDMSQTGTPFFRDSSLCTMHYRANGEIEPVELTAEGVCLGERETRK